MEADELAEGPIEADELAEGPIEETDSLDADFMSLFIDLRLWSFSVDFTSFGGWWQSAIFCRA